MTSSQLRQVDSTSGQKQLTIFTIHGPRRKKCLIKAFLRSVSTLPSNNFLSSPVSFPIGQTSTGQKKDEHIGRLKLFLGIGINAMHRFSCMCNAVCMHVICEDLCVFVWGGERGTN